MTTEDFEKSVPQMAKGRLSYKMPTPRPSLTPIRKKWESLEVKKTELFQITSKTTRTLVDLNSARNVHMSVQTKSAKVHSRRPKAGSNNKKRQHTNISQTTR